jgi:excisionase family DNA binding protein
MRKSNSAEILDNESVAKLLGCQPNTARRWAYAGKIPSHKVGSKIIYLRSEVMEWIKTK